MVKTGLTIVSDKTVAVLLSMRKLSSQRVYAGIPSEKAPRNNEEEKSINNAALMYIHETGDPEHNLPARPVVNPAIKAIHSNIIAEMVTSGKAALGGKPEMVDKMFHRLGIMAQNAMRKRITEGPFVPLSPRTIAGRMGKKGVRQNDSIYGKGAISSQEHADATGIRPLIKTGQLRRALTFVIRSVALGR